MTKDHLHRFVFFLPSMVYYALIFFLSSKSYQIKMNIVFFDKMIHLIEYTVLGLLLSLGFFALKTSFKSRFILIFISGSVLAGLDEIHQCFVPLRSMEVLDFAADVTGIILGFFIFGGFNNLMQHSHKKSEWMNF